MHLDSHKIFEAYVLSKNLEQQQLNEGIFDSIGGYLKQRQEQKQKKFLGKRKEEILDMYKKLWLEYWYPRFSDEKEIELNKTKAVSIFREFLEDRDWGEYEKNVKKALKYFNDHHGSMPYKELEKDAIEVLIYGAVSRRAELPSKKEKPAEVEKPETETPEETPEETPKETPEDLSVAQDKKEGMTLADYKKNKESVDKTYARKETVAPTPSAVATEPASETPEEPAEEPYKLKSEITRLKKLNQGWINAIKKKYGRTVRKPSDLVGKKSVVTKK